ncbi:MAG: hypothetical protein SAL70_14210 [Scytonema sp. PMC 1070.18]|nr:hypothetical protein [Scytonema sp. PMC 1070.18]
MAPDLVCSHCECAQQCHINWRSHHSSNTSQLVNQALNQVSNLIMIPIGGSSGRIRFAMHTWQTLTTSAEGFREYFQVSEVNSICVLPPYHVSGLMQFMLNFLAP